VTIRRRLRHVAQPWRSALKVACGAGAPADIFRALGRVVFTRCVRCKAKRAREGDRPKLVREKMDKRDRQVRRSVSASRTRKQLDLAPVDPGVHPLAALWSRAPRFPLTPRLPGAWDVPRLRPVAHHSEATTCPDADGNGCSRLSLARSFTLQRCDHETRNYCGGGRHIGDRSGKRQPLHDVGSCPGATGAARDTGGCDRGAGRPSGSTCAGAAEPACPTGLG
jgi:hypothetical protein